MSRDIRIEVPVLARVEGEGALELEITGNRVSKVRLRIYEPPRLFEKLLEGRAYHEVPDIVARICGICPVAYQVSAIQALESCFGYHPSPWTLAMRRAFYCGEWIQSHSLHIHLLALPDFLGFPGVIEMAERYAPEIQRGFRLQALGNDLIRLFGARSVHPIGARVGGFHQPPAPGAVQELLYRMQNALPDTIALLRWVAELDLPDDTQEFRWISLREPDRYPMIGDTLWTSDGTAVAISDFEQAFREDQVSWSTALHSTYREAPYLVGPLARLNNNLDRLPASMLEILDKTGIRWPSSNMFHSIVARAFEIHYALEEAIRILGAYEPPEPGRTLPEPARGTGFGCSEAPRGFLWHRYDTDAEGAILRARIVPPTSQNQARLEQDLAISLERFGLEHPDEALRRHAETVIRNYDPCISCATHFLELRVNRDHRVST